MAPKKRACHHSSNVGASSSQGSDINSGEFSTERYLQTFYNKEIIFGRSSSSSSHVLHACSFFFFVVPSPQKSLRKSAASISGTATTLNDAIEDPETAPQAL
ncbi:hypothetical protein TIFTF001_020520 [Ficus carica]|uniref:Uncharacterized protein n=1 Tax=Ficus carica TaxID=3494 RepID=A0AA88A8Q3_FICCA|nr:hypothetical protein TIFTF001_020520 [Ficus carica]